MRKRILEYRRFIDGLLKNFGADTNVEDVIENHLTQIRFFQHERLIHLLVTLAFAFFTLISVYAAVVKSYMYLLAVAGGFLILLIPYIAHYFILENETQKLYKQYDELEKIRKEKAKNENI